MVCCRSLNTDSRPPKLCYSLSLITFYFFLVIPCATPLTFSFPNIGPQHSTDIKVENDSYISSQGIQLTPDERATDRIKKAGRATYIQPLHLWDNATGELANFSTSFTFVIDSDGRTPYGDGIAFFLAANNSVISAGRAMGLPVDPDTGEATNQFVAVEFDTFYNARWDPKDSSSNSSIGDHAGISIKSLVSVKFEKWLSNITQGGKNEVWISYDSVSKNLSVVFTGYQNNVTIKQYGLNYIVDLRNELPEWVIFGFSAATGADFEKHNVKSWNFNSSDLRIDVNKGPTSPVTVIPKKKRKTGLVVGLSVGLCVLVGGLASLFFGFRRKRRTEENDGELGFDVVMDSEFERGTGPKKFSYNELAHATSDFAEVEKLGEGGFGGVYKGFLKELGSYVAVKRVSSNSKQGIKEYAAEVKIISRLRHRNLVQLIGWCHERKELLLVYEFLANGSLDSHLFKNRSLLTWEVRYKIVQGVASALLYLHEEWEQCVVHRDIKSSNIMLDSNFNPKLGDFGLARLVDHDKGSQTTILAGTLGYMAPECVATGKATKESDVFSFGVVALEIACGRKVIEFRAEESQVRLVEWVWDLYGEGKLLTAADPKLCAAFDEQEMERLMIVGLCCAHPDSYLRSSIRQAIQILNCEAPLPILPPKMPVATYFAPPTSSFSVSYSADGHEKNQTHSSSNGYNTESSQFTVSSASSSQSASLLYTI
ncbi:hypothetical protein RJ640_018573 [Escallonia rubra]|uniref:non-specific serine/threonine protein kinase n=1 Tax=Escallonia rubra TaxID=112253 RepID=A0AA88UME3_9ASTE|nr:hypothetical protein RJ640_018573 [Escallonia rubra]